MESLETSDDAISSFALCQSPLIHVPEPIAGNNGSHSELSTSKMESQKRRGRPRSLVFDYYSRIEDDNGMFLGNQCCFCSFISRDKSENSTYLSRHIQRACRAPDHVKEAVGWRKTSSQLFLPADTTLSLGKDSVGKFKGAKSANARDRNRSKSPSGTGRRPKTNRFPSVDSFSTAQTIPVTIRPSYSLQSKSTGTKFSFLNPLRSCVGKNRCVREPVPKLKMSFGKGVGTNDVENSFMFAKRDQESGQVLPQRALVPVEERSKSLNGLLKSTYYGHQYPQTSTVRQTIPELFRPSEYGKGSTNSELQDRISPAVRFMLAHHICFQMIESPVFRQTPFYRFQKVRKMNIDSIRPSSEMHLRIPSEGELLECLTNTSRSDIIDSFGPCKHPLISKDTGYLIICFADSENERFSNRGVSSSYSKRDAPVASYFCLTSDTPLQPAQLSYIGSRNCGVNLSFTCLSTITDEAESQVLFRFGYILLSRSVGSEPFRSSPRQRCSSDWTMDVRREADALCQDLLSKVPFLARVHRRNRIIASFFVEQSSEGTGSRLFGSSHSEREMYQSLLHVAQAGQSCKHRVSEMHKFLTSLSEENCGNIALCQEVVRLVLSPSYLEDLKGFITILKPLASLISLYSNDDHVHWSPSSTLSKVFRSRSIGYVLHDCAEAFDEMFITDNLDIKEFQSLKDLVFTRLFRLGPSGLPPIVSDVCYLASILNPAVDVDTIYLSRREVFSRAVHIARNKYNHAGTGFERVLFEFQQNKRASQKKNYKENPMDRFSKSNALWDNEYMDPLVWWAKYGERVPDLYHIALRVLELPATALSVIRYITNSNAKCEDLRGHSRDSLSEKHRFSSWNLKLGNSSLQQED